MPSTNETYVPTTFLRIAYAFTLIDTPMLKTSFMKTLLTLPLMIRTIARIYIEHVITGHAMGVAKPCLNTSTPPTSSDSIIKPLKAQPECSILTCKVDDHNGYTTGLIGTLQYQHDYNVLTKNGYKVLKCSLNSKSLCKALDSSRIIILRGHGHIIPDVLLNILNILKTILPRNPKQCNQPILVFQSCQLATDHTNNIQLSKKLTELGITRYYAPKQDIVASTLIFDNQNLKGVHYLPWYPKTQSLGLGRKMSFYTTPTSSSTIRSIK